MSTSAAMTTASNTAGEELSPPADLQLTPPQPVEAVPSESASGRVKLKPEDLAELDGQVRSFIDAMTGLDAQDPKFKDCLDRIHTMGNKDVEQSAGVSNRLWDRPVKTLKNGLFDSGSDISRALVDLRTTVERLDPSSQGDLFVSCLFLGFFFFR